MIGTKQNIRAGTYKYSIYTKEFFLERLSYWAFVSAAQTLRPIKPPASHYLVFLFNSVSLSPEYSLSTSSPHRSPPSHSHRVKVRCRTCNRWCLSLLTSSGNVRLRAHKLQRDAPWSFLAVGGQLVAANPVELAVGNVVRRDLSLATAAVAGLDLLDASDDDEDVNGKGIGYPAMSAAVVAAAARSTLRPPSLQTLLEGTPESATVPYTSSSGADSESKTADKSSITRKLKHDVIEGVNQLIHEIAGCHEQIAEQAVEHIHQNEVILTLGSSRTVLEFLCAAKEKKRSFRVFVAEGAPRYQGHLLAKELVARGLQTTVITDSAVFAMISRVNMVIIGAHAVMANGGVIGPVGVNMAALAAKKHAVPFVVLAGSHKLCPLYPHNPEVLLNELRSPSELLDFGEFSDCLDFGSGSGSPLLQVVNPTFDYVPPSLVSLFITDTGGHNPSYMYRLIADYYSADDLVM
ncbi:BnaA01g32370D [Brassica napus]|uniref:Translation initiation factor eIF2B subunit beta n=1 Tax=Brassica napus TaxID=3708 RepID=A0A078HB15_BRANA|nr:BnaA01g32370D [Brassica napus]